MAKSKWTKRNRHGFTNQNLQEPLEIRKSKSGQESDQIMRNRSTKVDRWEGNCGGGLVDLRQSEAPHLDRGDRRVVRGDQTALTGGGSVWRGSSGRGPGPPASVAEACHHLSGSLGEDELLTQLHVGPAFS